MTIKDIYIDGFRVLHEWSLSGLKKGINIITGRNEAGKSTLQKFIRYTLFGYPHRTEKRIAPIRGGVHGGRIRCLLSSGEEAIFERFAGSRQGDIKLEYHGETSTNASQWMQLLGNATQDLYNNVYAFSLDELVKLDSLKSSGVEDKLFSIGLGLGNTSIGDIESSLADQIQSIYTARGSNQSLPKLLAEFQQKKSQVQKIQDDLPIYQKISREVEDLQEQLRNINQDLPTVRKDYYRLKNYLACYDSFVEVENNNKHLDQLSAKQEYPENGIPQLDKLEVSENSLVKKIEELRYGNDEDKGLIDLEKDLNNIVVRDDLLKQQRKIVALNNDLARYKQALRDRTEDNSKITRQAESIRQQLQRIDSGWDTDFVRKFGNTILHKDKMKSLRQSREDLDKKRVKLETEESTLRANGPKLNISGISATISIGLLILSVVGFLYNQYIPGTALALIALIVFWRRRKYSSTEDPLSLVRQELKNLQDNEEPAWQKEYEAYLVSVLRLQRSLSTDSVLEILNVIDGVKKEIANQDELQTTQKNQRDPYILAYEQEAASLKPLLDQQDPANSAEELVQQAMTKFGVAQQEAGRKSTLEESILQKKKTLEKAEAELREIRNAIGKLLAVIGASDREIYRKKYQENELVKRLQETKGRAIQTIEQIAGINAFADVSKFLFSHDKAYLEDNIKGRESEIKELEKQAQDISSAMGSKISERDRIEGESALATHMTELEMLRGKLNQEYRNWAVGKIALKILGEVKDKYEKEKQPAVIKNSGRYFSAMTEERYGRISASLDEKAVRIYDALEAGKKIEQLSRGTKEQLLISLRLGFIEQYEMQSEPLPVSVDEIFVNFDPARLKKTARLLYDFAQTRQVLIFTCHPSTLDCFEGMDVNAISL